MTTDKRPVKIEEILSMCKTIASRYKRQDQYEDLVSEGVLVALELQEKEPNIAFSSIYMSVNKRMHDYLNIDLLPVHVPASDVARRLSRNPDTPTEEMGDNTWKEESIDYLKTIFKGGYVSLSDLDQPFDEYTETYEDKDFREKLSKAIQNKLSKEEKDHIDMRFQEGLSLQELGDKLGVSKMAVGKREKKLMSKLRGIVADLQ
jgi:RNA polymerase sigma factor (sigma-70 family)